MRASYERISAKQAADLILRARAGVQPLALFDSRDERSFATSHIKGTDHLTERSFGDVIGILPKDIPVMIYCYHGNASQVYANMFSDFNFKKVYSVDGGYEALAPVISNPPALGEQATEALVEFIEQNHFNPNNLDDFWDYGLTPVMKAALLGLDQLVNELIQLGVNVHLRNTDGNNALWLACVSENPNVVQSLIDAGINIDNKNLTGATALMYTASSGKAEMMKLLLDNGADAMIRNDDDLLAVELVATVECLRMLRHTAN